MSSSTAIVARQVRYQQWADDIRACNDRPKGITVGEWCKAHDINPNTYYWRLTAVRRMCLESFQPPVEKKDEETRALQRFVEMNPRTAPILDNHIAPATIRVGKAAIEINETISDAFLLRVMEAASHVE